MTFCISPLCEARSSLSSAHEACAASLCLSALFNRACVSAESGALLGGLAAVRDSSATLPVAAERALLRAPTSAVSRCTSACPAKTRLAALLACPSTSARRVAAAPSPEEGGESGKRVRTPCTTSSRWPRLAMPRSVLSTSLLSSGSTAPVTWCDLNASAYCLKPSSLSH